MRPVLGTRRSIIHLYNEHVLNESVTVVTLSFLQIKYIAKIKVRQKKCKNDIEVRQKKCIIGNE